jgi:hypothetical protein
MLVADSMSSVARPASPRRRGAFWLLLAGVLTSLALLASLAPHLGESSELVRLRNALLFDGRPAATDWAPAARPADFRIDQLPPSPLYADAVRTHGLRVAGDDWATALRIGQHLLQAGTRRNGPIQSDLDTTYSRIIGTGRGYCGDYADSFSGLATAAGLFVRSWAFSFDGFGGHGHIFNEVWDGTTGRWIAIDVYQNIVFVDGQQRPLSALELRRELQAGRAPRMLPVRAQSPLGFVHADRAIDYYRRGLPQWYLWWGNNVFDVDRAPAAQLVEPLGRPVAQLAAIAAGVYPAIRVLADAGNLAEREALQSLRWRLLALLVVGGLTLAALAWAGLRRWRQARSTP